MKVARVVAVSLAGVSLALVWNGWAEAGGNRHHRLHPHRPHHHHDHHRHHHHHHWHRHWPRIMFYSAPVVVPRIVYAPPPPTVYIERPQAQPDARAWWYYCREAQAYYPHVQTCPGEWQRVAPQPPPG